MDKNMGLRIKDARLKKGLTLKESGEGIGCSESTFSRYESGHVENIPLTRIKAISELFNVTPSYIMGWENDDGPKEEISTLATHAINDLTAEEEKKLIEYAKFLKSQRNSNDR